jgi:hypothetical protein
MKEIFARNRKVRGLFYASLMAMTAALPVSAPVSEIKPITGYRRAVIAFVVGCNRLVPIMSDLEKKRPKLMEMMLDWNDDQKQWLICSGNHGECVLPEYAEE